MLSLVQETNAAMINHLTFSK